MFSWLPKFVKTTITSKFVKSFYVYSALNEILLQWKSIIYMKNI